MNSQKPIPNLLVIRSADIHRAVEFYKRIGMTFELYSHGKGPEHYACYMNGFVFEIYPQRSKDDSTDRTRIGFNVPDVDFAVDQLRAAGVIITISPENSEWGRRAVLKDFDGHFIELVTRIVE